jgi:hypothetical protein
MNQADLLNGGLLLRKSIPLVWADGLQSTPVNYMFNRTLHETGSIQTGIAPHE